MHTLGVTGEWAKEETSTGCNVGFIFLILILILLHVYI